VINRSSILFGTKGRHGKGQMSKKQDVGFFEALGKCLAIALEILRRIRSLTASTLTDGQRLDIANWFASKATDELYVKVFGDIYTAWRGAMEEEQAVWRMENLEWSGSYHPQSWTSDESVFFGSNTGWRLPSVAELQWAIKNSKFASSSYIGWYWSSEETNQDHALAILVSSGRVESFNKAKGIAFRFVREKQRAVKAEQISSEALTVGLFSGAPGWRQ